MITPEQYAKIFDVLQFYASQSSYQIFAAVEPPRAAISVDRGKRAKELLAELVK